MKVKCKTVKEVLYQSGCNIRANRVYKSGNYGTMLDLSGLPDWKQMETLEVLDENGFTFWQPDPVHLPSEYRLEY